MPTPDVDQQMLTGDPLDPAYMARMWYKWVTRDPKRVELLANPITAADWLLKIRADALLDNTRLFRVAMKRDIHGNKTNYLKGRHKKDFRKYLNSMSKIGRMICEDIPAGYVLTNSPDAMCLETDGGKIIVVSEVVRYFLYFSNIGNANLFGVDAIPSDVSGSALLIAIRTMQLVEALDFDMDPRGNVPRHINLAIENLVAWQMRFVIGHEFAHHHLGHKGTSVRRQLSHKPLVSDHAMHGVYDIKRSWREEFEADRHSIIEISNHSIRAKLVKGAILFFLNLYYYENVIDSIDPDFSQINTHPPTIERLNRIIDEFGHIVKIEDNWREEALERQRWLAKDTIALLRKRPELLSSYGSIYLGSWQGRPLVDRVDY